MVCPLLLALYQDIKLPCKGISAVIVQDEARRHFGCPTLEGVELESQGQPGTAMEHWEKRVLGVSSGMGGGGSLVPRPHLPSESVPW